MTTRPPGMLLVSAIDFQTGNEEQAARRLAGLVQQQPSNRRARRLLAAAQWRMSDPAARGRDAAADRRPARRRCLYAVADRPRAGRDQRPDQAALYLARAAQPQPGALAALDPLGEGEFAAVRAGRRGADPDNGPAQVRY